MLAQNGTDATEETYCIDRSSIARELSETLPSPISEAIHAHT